MTCLAGGLGVELLRHRALEAERGVRGRQRVIELQVHVPWGPAGRDQLWLVVSGHDPSAVKILG